MGSVSPGKSGEVNRGQDQGHSGPLAQRGKEGDGIWSYGKTVRPSLSSGVGLEVKFNLFLFKMGSYYITLLAQNCYIDQADFEFTELCLLELILELKVCPKMLSPLSLFFNVIYYF